MPTTTDRRDLAIQVTPSVTVSGLLVVPSEAIGLYVLAHGAGAGMRHPFMTAVAEGLASRGIATLRYQFPYMPTWSGAFVGRIRRSRPMPPFGPPLRLPAMSCQGYPCWRVASRSAGG